ncbi:hypothetical protein [Dactylosporangium sp. NPDC000521]|uniref:hypothetical protein n=1 Tax=Dactylosporangium sp. NPDC000521 TaxID=3363975 RepID=UPI00369EDFA9
MTRPLAMSGKQTAPTDPHTETRSSGIQGRRDRNAASSVSDAGGPTVCTPGSNGNVDRTSRDARATAASIDAFR